MMFYEVGDTVKVFANDGKHPFPQWLVKLIDDGYAAVDFDNESEGGKLKWVVACGARAELTADSIITRNPAASRDPLCIFDTLDDFLEFYKLAPDSPEDEHTLLRIALQKRVEELKRAPLETAEECIAEEEERRAIAPYLDWLTRETGEQHR